MPTPAELTPLQQVADDFVRDLEPLCAETAGEAGPYVDGAERLLLAFRRLQLRTARRLSQLQPPWDKTHRTAFDASLDEFRQIIGLLESATVPNNSDADARRIVRQTMRRCEDCVEGVFDSLGLPTRTRASRSGESPAIADWSGEPYAILVIDLAQYTLKTQRLLSGFNVLPTDNREEYVANSLWLLNTRILGHVKDALCSTPNLPFPTLENCTVAMTGDGAVLFFPSIESAVQLAHTLHRSVHAENCQENCEDPLDRFHYRIGVSFSHVQFQTRRHCAMPHTVSAGRAFTEAARLCAQSRTGQVLIHRRAWERWASRESDLRQHFEDERLHPGKPGEESYPARAYQVVPSAPWDRLPSMIRRILRTIFAV